MTRMEHALAAALLLASCLAPPATQAQVPAKAVVTTGQVRAELMAHAPDGIGPGKAVTLGLQLTHQPDWHTYWKNPGDSGLPVALHWSLPVGVTAGEIAWPVPKKIPIGNLANYGFEGTVLLPVPLTIAADFKPAPGSNEIDIKLKANWLVCRKECIPEEGEFALKLPLNGSTVVNSAAFKAAFAAQPRALVAVTGGSLPDSTVQIDGDAITLSVHGLPVEVHGRTLDFFPETPEVIETAAKWTQGWSAGVWNARVPLSRERSNSPSVMPVLLVTSGQAFRVELKVRGSWPKLVASAANSLSSPAGVTATPAPTVSFWLALLGAFVGGLILNLMPCVFPVLAIKLMSFARHADDRRGHRISGLAYSAGVVLSFMALGALMLALRSAGEQLGWGFQLQSPALVAALAVLFTVMGLNLGGLFQFGQFLPSALSTLEARNPAVNAFLSGMLAVVVASPCTAPFMGASLGLALALPGGQALLIFASIGFGMALPYLAASLTPAAAKLLPRPGAWMDTLRRALAFPMFATVVWLLWVLGQQTGIDGVGSLLALLVALSAVLWSLTLHGRSRVVMLILCVASAVLLGAAVGRLVIKPIAVGTDTSSSELWQAWEPGRVEQALARGVPVFVDFTAAWCVTCQYNKKTTLASPEVLADLKAKRVTLLRADWTRYDPAISTALAQLGRNGIPVYVLYQSGQAPLVMSEILTVEEIRTVLSTL